MFCSYSPAFSLGPRHPGAQPARNCHIFPWSSAPALSVPLVGRPLGLSFSSRWKYPPPRPELHARLFQGPQPCCPTPAPLGCPAVIQVVMWQTGKRKIHFISSHLSIMVYLTGLYFIVADSERSDRLTEKSCPCLVTVMITAFKITVFPFCILYIRMYSIS